MMNDEEYETMTCDNCGINMNNTNEICEDCIYWSCDLIDENEDKVTSKIK